MASRYWVGGTGDWDATTTTHWSATTGGAGGQSVPTSADDVFFDANSTGIITLSANIQHFCLNLDFSGFTGTLQGGGGAVDIYGSLTLGSGMTNNTTKPFRFYATTTGHTITTNGITISGALEFNGVSGGWILQDNLILVSGKSIHMTNGTFDANNKNVTAGNFTSATTSTRTITMGSGTWELTGTVFSTFFEVNISNLTLNADTSTIKLTGTITAAKNLGFSGHNLTLYNFWNATSGAYAIIIKGSNTYNDFKINAGRIQHFQAGTTQTVTTFTAIGTAGNLITINSDTTGTHTLSKISGIVTCDYLDIQHSIATGGASWYAGVNSTNNQDVATAGSGWRFPFTNPANAYASDNTYTTLAATSGILTVEISKDAGVNWQTPETVTFTGSDSLQTCGDGSTELWGTSWTRADMIDANFRVRLTHGNYSQIYKTFGFATGTDILTGIEIAIEAKYATATISIDLLEVKIYYGTSVLPIQAGSQIYASDGRKAGEGAGVGTGVLVFYDGSNWIACDTGATVAA